MIGSAEILSALRELTNVKQLDRAELHALLQECEKLPMAVD